MLNPSEFKPEKSFLNFERVSVKEEADEWLKKEYPDVKDDEFYI